MAVAKMKLVNVVGRLRDFDAVVRRCCINGNFHPEQATTVLEDYQEFIPIDEPNPYAKNLRTLVDLCVHNGLTPGYRDFSKLKLENGALGEYIEKTRASVDGMNEKIRTLTQQAARLEQGIQQLEHIKSFDLSLDDIFSMKFIKVRFGRLPKESFLKLDVNEEKKPLFFFPLGEDRDYYWGLYVAHRGDAEEIDKTFQSLYFERIRILEEAHGTPAQAIVSISTMLENIRKQLGDARNVLDDFLDDNHAVILQAYSKLKYLHDSFELRRYSVKCGESFYMFGWVPESEIPNFAKQFDRMNYVDCIVENESESGGIEPPTSLVNHRAAKPFESFTEMYGLPSYNEIDPTPFMAFTYSVIFGIMFGDLGQGLVIFLVGLFLAVKKKSQLGGVILRCSVFSMIFGTLYNSVFGYENVLPFTVIPVHSDSYTNYDLLFAIGMGIFLIVSCMILNIINGFRQHDFKKIFFGNNGLAGLVFYIFAVAAVVLLMMFNKNIFHPLFIVLFIAVPLVIMFLSEPLAKLCERRKDWMPEEKGNFFIESFFELFEIILAFFSNTISFIRIGAFILSHAGMMLAVFSIADLAGKGGPVVVVLGNIFVILLEGLMVGIQGMRLQFYEMFSRFYTGGGREFEPVRIKYEN